MVGRGAGRASSCEGICGTDAAGEALTLSIPAADIERVTVTQIIEFLTDSRRLIDGLDMADPGPGSLSHALARAKQLASELEIGTVSERCAIIMEIVGQVTISQSVARIDLKREALVARLFGQAMPHYDNDGARKISIEAPMTQLRRGGEKRLIIEDAHELRDAGNLDPALIKAIARGHVWFDDLISGRAASIVQIAKRERVTDRYVSQMIGFAFVPPDMVDAIIEGRRVQSTGSE